MSLKLGEEVIIFFLVINREIHIWKLLLGNVSKNCKKLLNYRNNDKLLEKIYNIFEKIFYNFKEILNKLCINNFRNNSIILQKFEIEKDFRF